MSEHTNRLQLPYILPSQAQKHVTHNEALQRLDATTQLVVDDVMAAPPSSPAEGLCYLVADGASGEWSGKSGQLAFRQDEAWIYIKPGNGWHAWFAAARSVKIFVDGTWKEPPLPQKGTCKTLGIGTDADDYNGLTVASSASLFTHSASGGHQLKINKAGAADTASLLFQSGWSGRAEMGLAGNDAFSIKTSGDGAAFTTALTISSGGIVTLPNRPAVRAGLGSGTLAPADGSLSGFTELRLQQGGFSLGEVVAGAMRALKVPASGLYQITLSLYVLSSSGHAATLRVNGENSDLRVAGTATAQNTMQTASLLMELAEGDRLSLSHTGTCELATGPGRTELSMIRL